ncbi:hypothetical protein [Bacillus niameyensis]|uniref:hypothetical protein n=1 Tax=Bacillus niameyensis TaxID=1522308 RepID=UPI00078600DE|nr:hypothetical protein [Bacillus niameyensis]
MEPNYVIRVLKNHRNNLEDRLDEIAEGEYNHHSKEQVEIFKRRIIANIKDTSDAIKLLSEKNI